MCSPWKGSGSSWSRPPAPAKVKGFIKLCQILSFSTKLPFPSYQISLASHLNIYVASIRPFHFIVRLPLTILWHLMEAPSTANVTSQKASTWKKVNISLKLIWRIHRRINITTISQVGLEQISLDIIITIELHSYKINWKPFTQFCVYLKAGKQTRE